MGHSLRHIIEIEVFRAHIIVHIDHTSNIAIFNETRLLGGLLLTPSEIRAEFFVIFFIFSFKLNII